VPDLRDDELRDAFGVLHRSMQESAPTFAAVASPAGLQGARLRYRTRRASLLVAVVVIPAVVIARARATATFDFERFSTLTGLDPGAVSWTAPSDFLLSLPSAELLQGVPTIDVRVPVGGDVKRSAPASTSTSRRSPDS
jgi:hypothetical protein